MWWCMIGIFLALYLGRNLEGILYHVIDEIWECVLQGIEGADACHVTTQIYVW